MREIKFRAWDKKNRTMHQQGFVINPFGSIQLSEYYFEPSVSNKDLILMQYTNLKDKNGVEIYESDIYSFQDGTPPHVVEWGRAGWYLPNEDQIAVIGNIYKNPELLER